MSPWSTTRLTPLSSGLQFCKSEYLASQPIHLNNIFLKIQGAVMISSLFQIFIGFTGLVGFLLRFIGPLTVAPTIALVGLSLFGVCSNYAGKHIGVFMCAHDCLEILKLAF